MARVGWLGAGAAWVACAAGVGPAAASRARAASVVAPVFSGSLQIGPSSSTVGLGPLAVSGQTAVAGAEVLAGGDQQPGAVYVFVRPAAGWASTTSTATLTASDGGPSDLLGVYVGSVGVSGRVVVAGAAGSVARPGAVYVFAKPAGGWKGSLHEVAKLTASRQAGCVGPHGVAIAARTVVASCYRTGSEPPQGEVLVFSEPAAGWSGTRKESARLLPPRGGQLLFDAPVATTGSVVLAAGTDANGKRGVVYVFRKPARGWSQIIRPAATLTVSNGAKVNALAMAGRTVFTATSAWAADGHGNASAYAFNEPRRGWSGTVRPTARLTYPGDQNALDGTSLAASARTLVLSFAHNGFGHSCPCPGTINTFSAPAAGWTGTIHVDRSQPVSSSTGYIGLALQGRILFASDGTQVELFR